MALTPVSNPVNSPLVPYMPHVTPAANPIHSPYVKPERGSCLSRTFMVINQICDCIPGLSTVINLIDLFQKCLFRCFKLSGTIKNHYFKFIDNKNLLRCVLLLVPILGLFAVAIYNSVTSKKLFKQAEALVKDKPEEAAKIYEKASDFGHTGATCELAKLYQKGKGVPQCHEKAIELFTFAKDNDSSEARYHLAYCHEKGTGVPKDIPQAIKLMKSAARKGNSTANYQMGEWYTAGYAPHLKQDLVAAFEAYEKADEGDHLDGTYKLGECHFKGTGTKQDNDKAFKCFKKAGDKDHAQSLNKLAACYENGHGTPVNADEAKKCRDKAIELLKKSLAQK